jgi:hypothetical protein
MKSLERNNQDLKNELIKTASIIQNQSEIEALKTQYETLKVVHGSDDNKEMLKINSLIREIDYCIAQLSD